ncbi:MAG TPA: hypothetical protein PLL76_00110 [Thermoanaerobaculia bacterium]|nr:hypothetical protein [Thermoanaerobaculia bacterium]HQP84630.1 hypothetical protein [Thermoanaerobaculia bacterium]
MSEAVPAPRSRGSHPWRLAGAGGLEETLVFERRLFDAEGRPLAPDRETVDFAGAGLIPAVRLALAGNVLLGRLSPGDVRAVADELRAAGDGVRDLGGLLEVLGVAARLALDDPMNGVLTGPLQRALAGEGTSLLAALAHVCARPDPRDVLVYVDVFVRFRRGLVALALRLARELPPFPPGVLDGSVEVFAWFRETGARDVDVDVDGRTESVPLPAGLPEPVANAAAGAVAELLASLRRDAERLAHPRRDFSGVARDVGRELLDGLAGLLLNGLSLARAPRLEQVEARLVPAGGLPTRARHARSVSIAGIPFADALGRFFAVPSTPLTLPRTGRIVVVRRTGGCPFAVAGWSEATPHE